MCEITRRGFMVGCSASIAAMAGSRSTPWPLPRSRVLRRPWSSCFCAAASTVSTSCLPSVVSIGLLRDRTADAAGAQQRSGCRSAVGQLGVRAASHRCPLARALRQRQSGPGASDRTQRGQPQSFRRHGVHGTGDARILSTPTGWLTRHLQSSDGDPSRESSCRPSPWEGFSRLPCAVSSKRSTSSIPTPSGCPQGPGVGNLPSGLRYGASMDSSPRLCTSPEPRRSMPST